MDQWQAKLGESNRRGEAVGTISAVVPDAHVTIELDVGRGIANAIHRQMSQGSIGVNISDLQDVLTGNDASLVYSALLKLRDDPDELLGGDGLDLLLDIADKLRKAHGRDGSSKPEGDAP